MPTRSPLSFLCCNPRLYLVQHSRQPGRFLALCVALRKLAPTPGSYSLGFHYFPFLPSSITPAIGCVWTCHCRPHSAIYHTHSTDSPTPRSSSSLIRARTVLVSTWIHCIRQQSLSLVPFAVLRATLSLLYHHPRLLLRHIWTTMKAKTKSEGAATAVSQRDWSQKGSLHWFFHSD